MQEIRGSNGRGGDLSGPIRKDHKPEADFPGAGIKEAALPRLSTRSPSPIPRTRRRPCPATLLTQTLRSAEIQDPFPLSETHFFRYRTLSLYPETEDERALRLEGAFEQRDIQAQAVTCIRALSRRNLDLNSVHHCASHRNITHHFNIEGIAGSAFIRQYRDLTVAVAPHPTHPPPTSTTLQ